MRICYKSLNCILLMAEFYGIWIISRYLRWPPNKSLRSARHVTYAIQLSPHQMLANSFFPSSYKWENQGFNVCTDLMNDWHSEACIVSLSIFYVWTSNFFHWLSWFALFPNHKTYRGNHLYCYQLWVNLHVWVELVVYGRGGALNRLEITKALNPHE